MFRHTVLFRFVADADTDRISAVHAGLEVLSKSIDTIRAYHFGPDAGVNPGNFDYAVVADFDDEAGYLVYRDHPAHQTFLREVLGPLVSERAAVQFDLEAKRR